MKRIGVFVGLIIILFVGFGGAVVFYDQGTGVVNSTDATLDNGTIEIYIYDALSGGNLIYNANFTNNITNGSWNVRIEPDLEYGEIYYKDYVIEGDNLNFSGSDRIEFQSPFGVINNVSFINFSLIGSCSSGNSIRQIYENGSVVCEADDSGGSVNLTNYALINESVVFSENITTSSYGFFGWLGSLASRITSLFVVNINASGNIDAVNYTLGGATISSWGEVNQTAVDTDTQKNASGYLYNDSTTIYLNETLLNETIDLRDSDTTYSHLGNFSDDLGDRGYDNNLNFSNGANYWNESYATFNKTYADGLYASISVVGDNSSWNESYADSLYAELQWGYNQTTPAITWSNDTIQANNASWVSTYNSTYNSKADYQFAGNDFNGSGNFTTSGKVGIGIAAAISELHVIGEVNATSFIGDGSLLTGITSFILKYNAGNFNGSLYTTNAEPDLSDSNSLFQVLGSDGTPRFQIQDGGDEQASFIARSFIVVNQNNTRLNQSQNNLCSDWGFNHLDCNSSTTGADMGVQDDLQVQGLVFAEEGLRAHASDYGAYLALLENGLKYVGYNGSYNSVNKYFCDYDANNFVDNEGWIVLVGQGTEYENSPANLGEFVNSSCYQLDGNPTWVNNFSNMDWRVINDPVSIVVAGGFSEFNVGNYSESKFKINIEDGVGDSGFEVSSIAGNDQYISSKFDTDIRDYKGVGGIYSVVKSSVVTSQSNSNNLFLEFATSNINSGTHAFIKGSILGQKPDYLFVNLFELTGDFNTYIKQGVADEISKVYYDDGLGTTTDITNVLSNESIDLEIFENDNSIIYLGSTTNFTKFQISLNRTASKNLNFELYYCNTTGSWPQRIGITDTTFGFTSSGIISVEQSSPDRGTCNFEMDGTPFANVTNYTYVALKRTLNNVVVTPIEGSSSVSGSSSPFVLADDYIKLKGISAPPVTCDTSVDGAIYYDSDVQFHCSCKSGTGWVQMNDYSTSCS